MVFPLLPVAGLVVASGAGAGLFFGLKNAGEEVGEQSSKLLIIAAVAVGAYFILKKKGTL